MKDELLYFNGLYGDLDSNYGVDYIFSELIKTRSQTFDWVVRPHFHNRLFQIFCVESGNLIFQGNHFEKKLKAPFLILVPPMSIHGLTYSKNIKGRILTLSDSYLEAAFPKETHFINSIHETQFIENFEKKYSFAQIFNLILQIDEEIFSENPEQPLMIKVLLAQLFITLYRLFITEPFHGNEDSSYFRHFNEFQKLLKKTPEIKSIRGFANQLQISPIHLNRICKTITQKSALQIVHEHAIREAEKYLKHTSFTVAEIAYLLNFEYPNYFSKLFKKYTGLSPIQYRNAV